MSADINLVFSKIKENINKSDKRFCLIDKNHKTYFKKNGRAHWLRYKGAWICKKCYHRLVGNPKRTKEYLKKYYKKATPEEARARNAKQIPRLIRFKNRRLTLSQKARTGRCQRCPNNIFNGSCKRTHIHHVEYNEHDPIDKTIELCVSCHMTEEWKKRKFI
jgi:hypothetical protein